MPNYQMILEDGRQQTKKVYIVYFKISTVYILQLQQISLLQKSLQRKSTLITLQLQPTYLQLNFYSNSRTNHHLHIYKYTDHIGYRAFQKIIFMIFLFFTDIIFSYLLQFEVLRITKIFELNRSE